jgi:hypothetical protein
LMRDEGFTIHIEQRFRHGLGDGMKTGREAASKDRNRWRVIQ